MQKACHDPVNPSPGERRAAGGESKGNLAWQAGAPGRLRRFFLDSILEPAARLEAGENKPH